jgi:acyl dehydratase
MPSHLPASGEPLPALSTPASERALLYFEDLAVGQRYAGGRAAVELPAITAFAAAYDPQPFHLDEAAAKASIFGRLVASGWHTMALTMRLLVEGELRSLWGLVGLGVDELRWPRPVFPGDVLSVEWEVLEVRPSSSKPDRGTARLRITTRNQRAEVVLTLITTILVPRRPPAGDPSQAVISVPPSP